MGVVLISYLVVASVVICMGHHRIQWLEDEAYDEHDLEMYTGLKMMILGLVWPYLLVEYLVRRRRIR